MGTSEISARTASPSRNRAENHPQEHTHPRSYGVVHDNVPHTTRFVVVGNHLAQHAQLSLVAIGLSVHIQSLPPGEQADIKTLASKFPEGTTRIAAGLRELEAYGYLRRTRERDERGQMVTHTVSCNHPTRIRGKAPATRPKPPPRRPAPDPRPPTRRPETEPKPSAHHPETGPTPPPPRPAAKPKHPSHQAEARPPRALPAVPQPAYPAPDLLVTALDILVGLRREDPRLYLSATDAEHLAPGVVAWLERELTPDAVRRVLTFGLPTEPLRRPAALLAHRLNAQLPPLPPFRPPEPAARHPLQNCDTCDRAYRGSEPGDCGGCRTREPGAGARSVVGHPGTDRGGMRDRAELLRTPGAG
ncbi:helix-turn-helix domain-containing protein [Streptomyces sp. NK15101]|uniref:helix-turn-helix domain-containing protein n=1 Tax=Streptomyces sp. NK15101 TaxID=2873261 RepID=UPI001CECAA8B|nr:helix-turn-helix domain-containing protein [Streptomyces sp. NK15101]